jgi:hypothetical protein
MKKSMNRRMFLSGAGGAVMAIPFLPSVLSKSFAADPDPGAAPKCFFAIGTDHGDVWGKNMYPDDGILTQQVNYAGRDVRYGALSDTPDDNGKVVWSPMCTASAQVMTPALAQKFNILRGVDIPYRIAHHTGGHLGNFAATAGNVTLGLSNLEYRTATIDQVMAHSPSFYTQADLETKMTQRSFCVLDGRLSWNFSSPSTKSGDVVSLPAYRDNQNLFDYFFNPGSALHNVNGFIIDRVKQSYDLLKKDPRLSKGDLARLNQHTEKMFEIERKLKVSALLQIPPMPDHVCGKVGPGSLGADCKGKTSDHWGHHGGSTMNQNANFNADYCDLMTDIIATAFSTGASRVGTWRQTLKFADTLINAWHGQVAHSGLGSSVAQQLTLGWNQGSFEHILVNLAAKLDDTPAVGGGTLLDNSLLMLTSEAGQITHHSGCVHYPVVTAGGAGGYFKTGMFVDFSDKTQVYTDFDDILAEKLGVIPESPGLYYQQFLANALMSMGVPKEEWEHFTEFTPDGPGKSTPTGGYGFHYVDPKRAQDYAQAKLVMGDKLPVIT